MAASVKFLRPEILAALRGFELSSRRIGAGNLSGLHPSPYRGSSVEFAEHRPYTTGDPVRHVDWRLFGRKDRFYIKQFEEETNLLCDLVVDVSTSMLFGEGHRGWSKLEYAQHLAASLAWLIVGQNDSFGLTLFDSEARTRLAARSGRSHLSDALTALERAQADRTTDVKILFHELAESLRRRSLVILISDLLADADDVIDGLEHMCHAGHDLIVMHVMDHQEWTLPFIENVQFEGIEDEMRLLVDPQSLRASYLEAVEQFTQRVRSACLRLHADYVPMDTSDPLEVTLAAYLGRRGGRTRTQPRTAFGGR
jgi:uncharacterized protein (DUF58 family)